MKKAKTKTPSDQPYSKLVTQDGSLLMQREQGDLKAWSDRGKHYDGMEFAEFSIRIDCRERGVRLVSWKREGANVIGTVAWLK